MNETRQRPLIASYIILRRDTKIAFIRRLNTGWNDGMLSLPSGKVEQDESYTTCAIRETKEEVGVDVARGDIEPVIVMHRQETDETNWVDTYFLTEKWQGEPHNAEPHKSSELVWHDPSHLPADVIPSVRFALEQFNQGNHYCEYNWENHDV